MDKRGVLLFLMLSVVFNSYAQFRNVKITQESEGFKPRTPSVVINRKDPGNVVIAIAPAKSYSSTDGGVTWNESETGSSNGFGSPDLISDQKGNLFCFQQFNPGGQSNSANAWLEKIVLQESGDGGKTWGKEIFFGYTPSKNQNLFHSTSHPKKSILYTTWTEFDKYASDDVNCQSNIIFSMSMNGGSKWTKNIQLSQTPGDCRDNDDTAVDAMPAVTFDGKIYAAWRNKGSIFFDRSYDGGETWLSNDLLLHKLTGGRKIDIPQLGKINSTLQFISDISPTRANGALYIAFSDQQKDAKNSDVYFMRSTNKGDSWTVAKKVNSESDGYYFAPAMASDQTTGYLYIAYYRRQEYDDNKIDVYLAFSFNAGDTFRSVKISETSFDPQDMQSDSGLINLSAHAEVVVPVWTRVDNGKVSIMAARITNDELKKSK